MLKSLGIVGFEQPSADYSGLYLKEKRHGTIILRKLKHEVNLSETSQAEDILVYRYVSEAELAFIKKLDTQKVFVLAHNFYDLSDYAKNLTADRIDQTVFLYLDNSNSFKSKADLKFVDMGAKKIQLLKPAKKEARNKTNYIEYLKIGAIVFWLKLLLNPTDELKLHLLALRHKRKSYEYRFLEFLLFLHYMIHVPGVKLYYRLRHYVLTLWTVFYVFTCKIYGFAYDAGAFLHRCFRLYLWTPVYYYVGGWLLKNLFVPLKNFFLYTVGNTLVYKIIYRLLYAIKHFFRMCLIRISAGLRALYGHGVIPVFNFILYGMIFRLRDKLLIPLKDFLIYSIFFKFIEHIYVPVKNLLVYGVIYKLIEYVYVPVKNIIMYGIIYKLIEYVYVPVKNIIVYGIIYKLIEYVYVPTKNFIVYDILYSVYEKVLIPLKNILIYKVIFKAYYGFLHTFTMLALALRHKAFPMIVNKAILPLYLKIRYDLVNILRYTVPHYFMMCLYKSYGLGFDLVMYSHRVFKLYLLYPFFKIYWFSSYQYHKRLKKYFTDA